MAFNNTGVGTVARNDLARAFLFKSGVFKCGEKGEFVSCLSVDSLAQDRGDITKIECPSPKAYGQFVEVAQIQGELSRMTTTLTGRMSRSEVSSFYDLFINGCAFDFHLHFGLCQDPTQFNQYDKALIFENVYVTSFGTDPLVALQSGDRAVINETIDISIGKYYEVVNPLYAQVAQNYTVNGAIVSVEICDAKSCGADCDDSSNGCEKTFAATSDGYVYVHDNGVWAANAQVVLPGGATWVDGTCWGDYYVLLDSAGTFWYAKKDALLTLTPSWGSHASGLATTATSISAFNGLGVTVDSTGNISIWTDPEINSVVVDAGFASAGNALNDVYVGNDVAIAVGANGTVVYSYDGEVWYKSPGTPGAALTLTAVMAKSKRSWLVGTSNGQLWCTDNGGTTWTKVKYPGWLTNVNSINDIQESSNHIVWMAIGAKLYRSLDGGATWVEEPNSKLTFPTNNKLKSIAPCSENVNYVVVGGTSTTNTGFLVAGEPK